MHAPLRLPRTRKRRPSRSTARGGARGACRGESTWCTWWLSRGCCTAPLTMTCRPLCPLTGCPRCAKVGGRRAICGRRAGKAALAPACSRALSDACIPWQLPHSLAHVPPPPPAACDALGGCPFVQADRPNAVRQFLEAAGNDSSLIRAPWLLLIEPGAEGAWLLGLGD